MFPKETPSPAIGRGGRFGCGELQGNPAHEKVSGENGKKSDEELGEQAGASFEKLTGKEKLHDFIHHGREGRKAAQESCHQKRGGKGGRESAG